MGASNCLRGFRLMLRRPEALIALEKKAYLDPPKPGDAAPVEGLRGGAAILMVAVFEEFLRQMFQEHVGLLATDPPPIPFASLPEEMKVADVFCSLDRAMKARGKKRAARVPDIVRTAQRISRGVLDPSAFALTGSNPSAEVVKSLCKQVGIGDIWADIKASFACAWRAPVPDRFIPDKLDEIVNRRHRVAHTASALSVARSDLGEGMRFLRTLARALDGRLRSHIGRIIKTHTP